MKNKFLEKATQQALNEVLGYDEGLAYYLLLTKKELEKEFSYSKKYRLMKSLFDLGAMGKIKSEDQNFYSYIILPPSFLYSENIDKEIIEYLEKLYLENYSYLFEQEFSQLILKDEKILLIFLLKYFMKDEAVLTGEDFDRGIFNKFNGKVNIIKNKETRRKIGIIDRSFAFDFVNVLSRNATEYIGYVARNGKEEKKKGEKDYISIVEEQLSRF